MRIPESVQLQFKEWVDNNAFQLSHYDCRVSAGRPVPADQSMHCVELNDLLRVRSDSTFVVTVRGDSMMGAGINDGDHLIVDADAEPRMKDIVIVAINGEVTVKRLMKGEKGVVLHPENQNYSPISLDGRDDIQVQGVVRAVIHTF